MFAHGMGVEENIPLALRWLRKAAEQDNNIALRELGFLYDEGKGVPQEFYEKPIENKFKALSVHTGNKMEGVKLKSSRPKKYISLNF
jgi:TPR repeat protein